MWSSESPGGFSLVVWSVPVPSMESLWKTAPLGTLPFRKHDRVQTLKPDRSDGLIIVCAWIVGCRSDNAFDNLSSVPFMVEGGEG
jgi:hypothetical protein